MISPESVLAFTKPDSKFYEDNLLAADDWAFDSSFHDVGTLNFANDPASPGVFTSKGLALDGFKLKDDSQLSDDIGANDFFCGDNPATVIKEEPLSPYSLTSLPSSPEHEFLLESPVSGVAQPPDIAYPTDIADNVSLYPPQAKRRLVPCNDSGNAVAQVSTVPIQPQPNPSLAKVVCPLPQHYIIKADPKALQGLGNVAKTGNLCLPLPSKPTVCPSSQPVAIKLESTDVSPSLICVNANGIITAATTSKRQISTIPNVKGTPTTFTSNSTITPCATSIVDSTSDTVKGEKRQQRMIKNRESASLSRKRKKEYLQTLEERINLLTSFNSQLKCENESLKNKVKSLETENLTLKHHPSDTVDSLSTVKKTTCFLAVFFLLSLNINSFRSPSKIVDNVNIARSSEVHVGRHLLQVEDNDIAKQDFNYRNSVLGASVELASSNKLRRELSIALKDDTWKSHTAVSSKDSRDYTRKAKRKRNPKFHKQDDLSKAPDVDVLDILEQLDCGTYFNKTDVDRITHALEALVKRQSRPNKRPSNVTEPSSPPRNCTQGKEPVYKTLDTRWKNAQHNTPPKKSRLAKVAKVEKASQPSKNGVLLYQSRSFADSIKREDDTFYVMSLRPDHLILPARRYNNTQRPKVSFMLPAFNDTRDADSGFMQLMQIDCHVMDMKVISVDKNILPQPMSF